MRNFAKKLNAARRGGGILFCGAGFSADCLGFNDNCDLGTAGQLCQILTEALEAQNHNEPMPKKLKNLADTAKKILGEHGLLKLLQEKYIVRAVTDDIEEILKFPWHRIYTTNYDNAIENGLIKKNIQCETVNNLDDIRHLNDKPLQIVHLHGFINKWDIHNFDKSCILGANSYRRVPDAIGALLSQFREDCERAELIVFVGYNAQDMHISEALYGAERLRDKIYFVNKETAEPDPDIKMEQEQLGRPLYIGRLGFAENIREALKAEPPSEPNLSDFVKYQRCSASSEPAGVKDLEDLFIWGERDAALLAHDIDNNKHDYHVPLPLVTELERDLNSGTKIAFITGGICDGKTFAVESLLRKISVSRPVYELKTVYDNFLREIEEILKFAPKAVLVIENCFNFSEEKLLDAATKIGRSKAALILTSRDISTETKSSSLKKLREMPGFKEYEISVLKETEIAILAGLLDQTAAWHQISGRGLPAQQRFIIETCSSRIPNVLVELLDSSYVCDLYKKEYNKLGLTERDDTRILAAILYIASLDGRVNLSFLDGIFKRDIGKWISNIAAHDNGMRLLRVNKLGEFVETLPSIGGRNFLRTIISDDMITDAIANIVEYLDQAGFHSSGEYHVSRYVRYSLIVPFLIDKEAIIKFYDRISKFDFVRRNALFWLQWSIALRELGKLEDSRKRLDEAYKYAERYADYDYKQLDDVNARLLIAECESGGASPAKIERNMGEASGIIYRYLQRENVTHHSYISLQCLAKALNHQVGYLSSGLIQPLRDRLKQCVRKAEDHIGLVASGYQRRNASEALEAVYKLFPETKIVK